MRNLKIAGATLAMTLAAVAAFSAGKPSPKNVFAKDNLVAWCIVPFDAAHRGPMERAHMLKRLGITMLAYDWREKDIPTSDQEVDALKEHGHQAAGLLADFGSRPGICERRPRGAGEPLNGGSLQTEIW